MESVLNINRLLIGYCKQLVADIDDERMAEQPFPGVNHPAWILGHLAFSADRGGGLLGAQRELPRAWTPQFGPGSKPSANRGDYPSKDELLQAFEQSFDRLRQVVSAATEEQLSQPSANPFTKAVLPTMKDWVAFILTAHMAGHLGQLSMWRRMIGLPPLF